MEVHMVTNDGTIIKIKHDILCEVAKLVFAGKFEEEKEELPYRMMPGPKAKYRCCVYKEREIVRQRIRLAEGKSPQGAHNNLVVQVVQAACEDCPISRYVVTDNCQKCMGKACQQSCNFGAIDIGRTRAHIDPQKCRECGKCAAACPYNAIADLIRPCRRSCPVGAISMDENGICIIDEKKCIQCGRCIHSCPFGAISSKSCVVDVCQAIVEKKHVYAMFAPSTEGQFGEGITFESWRNALKEVGFTDLVEVGLGGDMTAYAEAAEWAEAYRDGKKMTTSCCPGFVNLIRLHYPDLLDHISTTVSPMCAVSRWIKSKDPEAITVFVGPCIAKKSEVIDQDIPGSADYAMTYGEIRAIIRAKGITIHEAEETNQQSSTFGKWFGNSGGPGGHEGTGYHRRSKCRTLQRYRCLQACAADAEDGTLFRRLYRGHGVRRRLRRRSEPSRRSKQVQACQRKHDKEGGQAEHSRKPGKAGGRKDSHAPQRLDRK